MGQTISFIVPDYEPTPEEIGKIILEMINFHFYEDQIDDIIHIMQRDNNKSKNEEASKQ